MRFSSGKAGTRSRASLQEALVVPHHQLGLELLDGIEGNTDDDQDRGPAEEEVGRRLADQDGRQRSDGAQIEGAGKGEPGQDAVQVFGGRSPWAYAGDEPAVL